MEKIELDFTENGPILAKRGITLVGAFCRCGQSKSRPACDGSHRACGFKAEKARVQLSD